uniref:CPSF_A domain-containing protein n=1 Tax=Rhabditophanes sp. KR3021 TaxID=114890 RepID=A0AC35TVE6_9BILA
MFAEQSITHILPYDDGSLIVIGEKEIKCLDKRYKITSQNTFNSPIIGATIANSKNLLIYLQNHTFLHYEIGKEEGLDKPNLIQSLTLNNNTNGHPQLVSFYQKEQTTKVFQAFIGTSTAKLTHSTFNKSMEHDIFKDQSFTSKITAMLVYKHYLLVYGDGGQLCVFDLNSYTNIFKYRDSSPNSGKCILYYERMDLFASVTELNTIKFVSLKNIGKTNMSMKEAVVSEFYHGKPCQLKILHDMMYVGCENGNITTIDLKNLFFKVTKSHVQYYDEVNLSSFNDFVIGDKDTEYFMIKQDNKLVKWNKCEKQIELIAECPLYKKNSLQQSKHKKLFTFIYGQNLFIYNVSTQKIHIEHNIGPNHLPLWHHNILFVQMEGQTLKMMDFEDPNKQYQPRTFTLADNQQMLAVYYDKSRKTIFVALKNSFINFLQLNNKKDPNTTFGKLLSSDKEDFTSIWTHFPKNDSKGFIYCVSANNIFRTFVFYHNEPNKNLNLTNQIKLPKFSTPPQIIECSKDSFMAAGFYGNTFKIYDNLSGTNLCTLKFDAIPIKYRIHVKFDKFSQEYKGMVVCPDKKQINGHKFRLGRNYVLSRPLHLDKINGIEMIGEETYLTYGCDGAITTFKKPRLDPHPTPDLSKYELLQKVRKFPSQTNDIYIEVIEIDHQFHSYLFCCGHDGLISVWTNKETESSYLRLVKAFNLIGKPSIQQIFATNVHEGVTLVGNILLLVLCESNLRLIQLDMANDQIKEVNLMGKVYTGITKIIKIEDDSFASITKNGYLCFNKIEGENVVYTSGSIKICDEVLTALSMGHELGFFVIGSCKGYVYTVMDGVKGDCVKVHDSAVRDIVVNGINDTYYIYTLSTTREIGFTTYTEYNNNLQFIKKRSLPVVEANKIISNIDDLIVVGCGLCFIDIATFVGPNYAY